MSTDDPPEITAAESPWAKVIRDAVRRETRDLEGRLCAALVSAVSPRLQALESADWERQQDLQQVRIEVAKLNRRVDVLERRYRERDTIPVPSEPPPSSGPGDDA